MGFSEAHIGLVIFRGFSGFQWVHFGSVRLILVQRDSFLFRGVVVMFRVLSEVQKVSVGFSEGHLVSNSKEVFPIAIYCTVVI